MSSYDSGRDESLEQTAQDFKWRDDKSTEIKDGNQGQADGARDNLVSINSKEPVSAGGMEKYKRKTEKLINLKPTGDLFEDYLNYLSIVRGQDLKNINLSTIDPDAARAYENQDEDALNKIIQEVLSGTKNPGHIDLNTSSSPLAENYKVAAEVLKKILDAYTPGFRVQESNYSKAA